MAMIPATIYYKDIDNQYSVLTTANFIAYNGTANARQIFNLLLSNTYSKPFDPLFGIGLDRYLFTPATTYTAWKIRNLIYTQVPKWMGTKIKLDKANTNVTLATSAYNINVAWSDVYSSNNDVQIIVPTFLGG